MILKLFVDKDAIKLDQKEEPASDSREVLYCKFRFTHDWDGYVKHVLLWTDKDQVRRDVQLDESSTCLVPQALIASGQHHLFLTVYGLKANERHTAAFFAILIRDSGYEDDSEPLTTLDIDIDGAGTETYDVSSYTYAEVNVPQGSVSIPSPTITANPVMSVDNNGKVVAAVSTSETVTPTVEEGWVSSAQSGQVNVSGSGQLQLDSWAGRTITPTEQAQVAVPEHKYTLGEVNIGPIPPEYIVPEGTIEITQNGTYDIGEYDEAEVNVPGGSAPVLQTKSATPTETAQTVTADQGYDGLGQVNVGAIDSEYVGSDVPRYDYLIVGFTDQEMLGRKQKGLRVSATPGYYEDSPYYSAPEATFSDAKGVSIDSSGDATITFSPATHGVAYEVETYTVTKSGAVTPRTSSDLSASGATIQVPAGFYAAAASKSVASGSASTPATSITANPSISVSSSGLITATASASQSVTPSVSAGWVSSGTSGTVTVSGSNTSQLSTQAAATITPTTSQQTAVASGKYTTGNVVVDPIPSQYIIPTGTKSITANGTGIDVKAYEYVDVSVSGGGGGESGDLIHNWDLKSSLTDTIGGIVATTTGSIGSDGLTLSTPNTYIDFGQIYGTDKTYFMDIVSLGSNNTSGSSNFARLFAVDTDTDTSVGGAVLVYSKSSQRYGWRFYTGSAFDNNQINTRISVNNTRDYFDGKTVAIYIDASRKWHLFSKGSSDGYFTYEGISVVMNNYTDGHVYIGSSANDVICTAIISGFRVYDGFAFEEATAEEIVAILGGENE